MNLVEIDGIYFNIDRVDGISFGNTVGNTHIFVGGSERPFIVDKNIDEVVERMKKAQQVREKE